MPPKGNIVEALKNMEGHEIVVKLLENTDLATKLAESSHFTFLAPTDEAFERMRDFSVEQLLENNTLAEKVLKLHILPGKVSQIYQLYCLEIFLYDFI